MAIEHNLEAMTLFKDIVIMGGALYHAGNVTPHAEANIWNDPHAADAVFKNLPNLKMIGLDVTSQILCTQSDFDANAQKSQGLVDGSLK